MAIETMADLRERAKRGEPITVMTPRGPRRVLRFHDNGVRERVRVTARNYEGREFVLTCTPDHELYVAAFRKPGRPKISDIRSLDAPAPLVKRRVSELRFSPVWGDGKDYGHGEFVLSAEPLPKHSLDSRAWMEVIRVEPIEPGLVCDLEIDDPDHWYGASGFAVANCNSLSEVRAITNSPGREHGDTHGHLVRDARHDDHVHSKLLVEVRIDPGRYGALTVDWLRCAVQRAFLLASEGKLVDALVADRYVHSRSGYRIRSPSFRNLLSGSFLVELAFNRSALFTPQSLLDLHAAARRHVTAGWDISSVRQVEVDHNLRTSLNMGVVTYRFDSRVRQGDFSADRLRAVVQRFYDSGSRVKYKVQQALGRFTVQVVERDYDKSAVRFMSSGSGRNEHETVLRFAGPIHDSHPLLILSGLFGTDDSTRALNLLYGTETVIEGFYRPFESGVFEHDSDFDDDAADGVECRSCGENRWTNLATGLPFGSAPHEVSPEATARYGSPVCASCWATYAP